MKKIKYIFTIIAVVMLGIISLADNPVELRIPNETATIGDFINIPVYVDNSVTGENILSYQFKIYYYSSHLSFVSIETAGTLSQSWGTPTSNASVTNNLFIAGAGSTPLSGTGVLFYMRFECISSGASQINFDGGDANNFFNEGTPGVTLDNGYISIAALPTIYVYPDNGLLTVGDQLQFNVSGGTAPYSWYVTNPAIASINSFGLLSANYQGFTRVVAEDNNGTRDTTGWIEVRAMQLRIPDTTAWQGSTIDIPIYTTDITGLNIMSGNISFTFNQNLLTPTILVTTGTMLDGYSVSFNNLIAGNVNIAFAGTTTLSGSSVLLYIRFDVSSVNTGSTGITFNEAIFNEDLPATTDNGYFTTINYSTITVSPNTYTIVAGETRLFTASGGIPPYSWVSSDNSVATIDAGGLLTAHHSGVIQVTAIDNVGATGSCGNISVYDAYLDIADVSAMVNSIYDLPVNISDFPPGEDIYSFNGTISFETPELAVLDILPGPQTAGWSFVKNISGSEITFACAGTSPMTTGGTLFKIQFQLTNDLTPGENAWVNIDNITINEGIPLTLNSNGSITGTSGLVLSLDVNLEGPFEGGTMRTDLPIPNSQPYNTSPWSYSGSESAGVVPGNVTDWILVELRDAPNAALATPGNMIARKAAFLTNTGDVVGMDGVSNIIINAAYSDNLFVVIWHRNHLGIMSSVPVTISGGVYTYDFTTSATKAYGGATAQVNLGGGEYGIYSGNYNGDNNINTADKTGWEDEAGASGYQKGDFNMDSQVDNNDKNEQWIPNNGKSDFVPD